MYKIKITKQIIDIFAQYKGIWLDNQIKVGYSNEDGSSGNSLTLNSGDEISINTDPIGNQIKQNEIILGTLIVLDKDIKVNGVLSIYAKNPSKGILLTITKLI